MKIAVMSDLHFINIFVSPEEADNFWQRVAESSVDAAIICGDIAESALTLRVLNSAAKILKKPVLFVLGNHDFYKSSFFFSRQIKESIEEREDLIYLHYSTGFAINDSTYIVGVDGWGDAGYTNISVNEFLPLNDFNQISDLANSSSRLRAMKNYAEWSAVYLENQLEQALKTNAKKIIIVTHVPPFSEICFYKGLPMEQKSLAVFSCKKTGDVIRSYAEQYPEIQFQVYCGHTHSAASLQISSNLHATVLGAEYGKPKFAIVEL
mgnify:CR=1 FL=1